jgi:cold shock CspA family protein
MLVGNLESCDGDGNGEVVQFTKGYGFIQPQGGGGKDVFVHISAVEKAGSTDSMKGRSCNTMKSRIGEKHRRRNLSSSDHASPGGVSRDRAKCNSPDFTELMTWDDSDRSEQTYRGQAAAASRISG